MNENEQLARWLGWTKVAHLIAPEYYDASGGFHTNWPDFRSSNEWTGKLLEKFQTHSISLQFFSGYWYSAFTWFGATKSMDPNGYPTWRAAVIAAALEVIRRDQ